MPPHPSLSMRGVSIAVLFAASASALRTPCAQPRAVPAAAATERVASSYGRRAALLAGAAAACGAQLPALAARPLDAGVPVGRRCRRMRRWKHSKPRTRVRSERVITHTHSATQEPAQRRSALRSSLCPPRPWRSALHQLRLSARLAAPSTSCSGRRRVGGAQGQL